MANKNEFKIIKKRYGEAFAQYCRTNFSDLMDKGILYSILSSSFDECKFLHEDVVKFKVEHEFKAFIYGKAICMQEKMEDREDIESPEVLMKKAGYILKKCTTEEEMASYIPYYREDELLCSFREMEDRLATNDVFFAVKENVDEIKRENFTSPKRQDEYGVSVISLQFERTPKNRTLSIKNRYNHNVQYPDATFSNDLENIYPGLTESFKKYYGIDLTITQQDFKMPTYILANDGKFYKYNFEIDGVYYCPNNVIIKNFDPIKYDKSQYDLIDYFIIDKKNKTVDVAGDYIADSFIDQFKDIENIVVKNDDDGYKSIKISTKECKNIEIIVDKLNQIVQFKNPDLKEIGDFFMWGNKSMKFFTAPNVENVGDGFLSDNRNLLSASLPKVVSIGNEFLLNNEKIEVIELPNVEYVGDDFLARNRKVFISLMPKVEEIGSNFLAENLYMPHAEFPELKKVGSGFLSKNERLVELTVPKLSVIMHNFLYENKDLEKLELPNVEYIGDDFLKRNVELNSLTVPKLEKVGNEFLLNNKDLLSLDVPNLKRVGYSFLWNNDFLSELNAPNLEFVGEDFLWSNDAIRDLELPNLRIARAGFLKWNESLLYFHSPKLEDIDEGFLGHHKKEFKIFEAPNIKWEHSDEDDDALE